MVCNDFTIPTLIKPNYELSSQLIVEFRGNSLAIWQLIQYP